MSGAQAGRQMPHADALQTAPAPRSWRVRNQGGPPQGPLAGHPLPGPQQQYPPPPGGGMPPAPWPARDGTPAVDDEVGYPVVVCGGVLGGTGASAAPGQPGGVPPWGLGGPPPPPPSGFAGSTSSTSIECFLTVGEVGKGMLSNERETCS